MANVIISRIQNRRGLKQDLPQPLRPGELGFAIDSRQLFIGADPDDTISGNYNKISVFESTTNSKSITQSIANNNLVSFTVPYKKFPKGTFDGVTKTASWLPSSNTYIGSGLPVFGPNVRISVGAVPASNVSSINIQVVSSNTSISVGDRVQGATISGVVYVEAVEANTNVSILDITLSSNQNVNTGNTLNFIPNNMVSVVSNTAFVASDLTVVKNGVTIEGDSGNTTPAANKEYSFAANSLSSNSHIITFRTYPSAADEISVAYYSNSAVIGALSSSGTIFPGTSKQSFYTEYGIPEYRQIADKFVTVCAATGTGLIGLQHKHIAVTADSTAAINSPESVSLGNLLVSRTSEQTNVNVTIAGDNTITFDVGSDHGYALVGPYNYILLNESGGSWLDGKVFKLSGVSTTSVTANISGITQGNAAQTARPVAATLYTGSTFGANANILLTGNISGVAVNDVIRVLDSTAGSNIDGNDFTVASVNTSASAFVINCGSHAFSANVASGVRFINYGSSNANVQVFSPQHGFDNGETIIVESSNATGTINNTTYTIFGSAENTFFIVPTAVVQANVTFTITPDLSNSYATTSVTRIRSIDLSSATSVTDAISLVNDVEDYPQLNFIPNTTNTVYFTHKAAYSSIGLDFGLHEDPNLSTPTLSVLKLAPGFYDKNTTVKAKLERWMNSLLESEDVNLFSSAKVGEVYSTDPNEVRTLGTYTLDIDNTFDELTFGHRDEARDFNSIVNDIYFERSSSDIRGLVNLKTNIELQTKTAAVIGDKTVSYTDMNTASIAYDASNSVVSSMQQSSSVYDSYIVDYTITEAATESNKYQRMGQLLVSSRSDFDGGNGAVIFQDFATEMTDTGLSGNVLLEAYIGGSNTTINIHATNNLSPSTDLEVKYIVRRWSSLPG